jgi:hypothetical protein
VEDLNLSVYRFTSLQEQDLPMLLSQLPHLTQLQLSGDCEMPAGMRSAAATSAAAKYAAITTSSSQQHLKLYLGLPSAAWRSIFSADCQLPHLKSLELDLWPGHERCLCSPSSFPGFTSLSALQRLRLNGWDLDPEVLLGLPALQTLQLQGIVVQSAAEAAALMDVLPQLKQLHLLSVSAASFRPAQDGYQLLFASPSAEVFAGRQHLKLGLLRMRGGFWTQLFVTQRLLPYLELSSTGSNPAQQLASNSDQAAADSLTTGPALANWMLVESAGHGMATKVNCVSQMSSTIWCCPTQGSLA